MTQESPQGTMTVKDFRDRSGIGRNVAIDVLEFFDGKGFTRRQGNERIVGSTLYRLSEPRGNEA
jgi:selenocysteine-specific elongation factor